jgi:pimeloyl-ACP methyl ester carboxylesterase
MGGAVALEIAARAPVLPAALALVDPALIPGGAAGQMEGFVAALESPDYQTVARGFIEHDLFMPTDDERLRTQITEVMLDAPQDVMVSEMKSMAEWWSASGQLTWTMPVLAVLSGRTLVDPHSLGERCTTLETANTPGVGHFNQLLAPDAVNAAIEAFLARRVRP